MAWHKYTEGEAALLHEVLTICEKHISSGDVKNPEEKRLWLQQIRDCGHSEIVYQPQGKGWGSSPLNPNNWRTLNGEPICQVQSVTGV